MSSHHGEWLTFDPMLKWSPENLIKNPTDMNGLKYVNGDPVNLVDPSGYASYAANLERRRQASRSMVNKGVKFATSLAIGSEFVRNVSKVGLGVTFGELIKSSGNVATLGRLGTVGNFAITTALKSAMVGGSFWAGTQVGNMFGAWVDTMADNSPNSFLNDIGFGSGDFNSTPKDTFSISDTFDSYFGGENEDNSSSGGLNSDNYSFGDYSFD
ncbi:hypothetical protein [Halobacteriovorax sp. JY17]|uniref:hypothetical protein n=1 Tax=Halobacteriovorax sp. JY17 TaxID=2014617 RepID=UPI000C5FFB03|nr:hypothetical protein [Halobacteriovorax sp. JY17]PIK14740.1 MAG: hypothetical protein CES88_10400 [Halobacteriovorax sp. JY17]